MLAARDGREHGFPFPVADGLLGGGGVAIHPHPGLAEDAATVAPWVARGQHTSRPPSITAATTLTWDILAFILMNKTRAAGYGYVESPKEAERKKLDRREETRLT